MDVKKQKLNCCTSNNNKKQFNYSLSLIQLNNYLKIRK